MISDFSSYSAVGLASPSAPWLGVGCIADDHVTVNEDERLLDKLEGFQAKAVVALWWRQYFYCVINSAAVKDRWNRKERVIDLLQDQIHIENMS